MRNSMILTLTITLFTVSLTFAAPGDIIRHQSITGDPPNGIYGFAMDWSDGNIWVAGNGASINDVEFSKIDPETLEPVTSWNSVDTDIYWVLDIGYGFSAGGYTNLIFADDESPFLKAVDPATGDYIYGFDDYFTETEGTAGSTVDTGLNRVYISSSNSGYNGDIPYFESGNPWELFVNIPTGNNSGLALGWDRLFILHNKPYSEILVYTLGGTLEETIPISGLDEYMIGLACCRVNAVGDNESLIFRSLEMAAGMQVYEVEVGDYVDETSVKSASLGEIKAAFK